MKYLAPVFQTLFVLVLLAVFWWIGPDVETKYWPVVRPLTITRTEAVDADHTRIWVRFEKNRGCQPVGVYWYRGRRGRPFDQIGFVVERPNGGQRFVNRPLGDQTAGPWVIEAAAGEIGNNVFADAQHSCNPAWTTISRFYR